MGNNGILIKILFTIILHFLSFNSFCFIQNINHYRSIQLKNGNLLVVSDKGVYIYDRTLKNEMNHIDIEQGPSNYLDYELKHIGEENEGYILLCTINNFYVFSSFGEFLHKYEIPKNIINTEKNDFYSLITYEYENNNNYFFYSYHPKSKSFNYFIKFNYNSEYNNITFISETHFLSVIEAFDNVSCQMIEYNDKNNLICLMLSKFIRSNTFYLKIYDPDKNFYVLYDKSVKKDYKTFLDSKTSLMNKDNKQKLLTILYYNNGFSWIGFDINTKEIKQGDINEKEICQANNNHRDIKYFKETNEFIVSFVYNCKIDGKSKLYNLIYSFNDEFSNSFLGAIRNFTIGDSCDNCNPFNFRYNYNKGIISHNILFSSVEQKYCIISNVLYNNKDIGVSLSIFNKEKNDTNYASIFCENYSNFKNVNCSINDLMKEINNSKIEFIETCNYDFEKIKFSCNSNFSDSNNNFYNDSNNDNDTYIEENEDNESDEYCDSIKECNIESILKGNCKLNSHSNNTNSNEVPIKNLLNAISDGSINGLLNNTLNGDQNDIVVGYDNIIYQITSTENQKNKKNKNISCINLGKCENILKEHYNININESLLILKLDKFIDYYLVPTIEYQIIHPENKTPLDLNLCSNTTITYDIPVKIDENELYIYDQNSPFYNDLCCICNSDNKTDIIIKDRRNEFINKNRSLCQSNCKFINYDKETKMSKCECSINEVKNNDLYIFDVKIDKERLYDNFIGKTSSNIEVIKCYYLLFNINSLASNIGSYVIIFIILSYLVCTIIFCVKGYKLLIQKIYYLLKKNNLKKEFKKKKNKKRKKIELNHMVTNSQELKLSIPKNAPIKKSRKKKKTFSIIRNRVKDKTINESNTNKTFIKKISEINTENFNKDVINNDIKNDKSQNISNESLNIINILKMDDFEINRLSYLQAMQYDNRTYFQYYWSVLKMGHIILFTILPNNDYNSIIIKICLFLFSFGLYYTINALFFTNSTMHQIYIDEGKFKIIYQIPHIIYTTIISSAINALMKWLSLIIDV